MRTLEIVHRTRYEYAEPVTLNDYRLMSGRATAMI